MNSAFGNRIKALRKERNITQQMLADVLGIAKTMISAYENNTRRPSYENLMEIALFFDVSMDWLFDNTDDRSGLVTMDLSQLNHQQKQIIINTAAEFKRLNRSERVLKNSFPKSIREFVDGQTD